MPEPSQNPLERRHTETAQNAAESDGAPAPNSDDAEGARILKIVVAMFLTMFVIAIVALIFVARSHELAR